MKSMKIKFVVIDLNKVPDMVRGKAHLPFRSTMAYRHDHFCELMKVSYDASLEEIQNAFYDKYSKDQYALFVLTGEEGVESAGIDYIELDEVQGELGSFLTSRIKDRPIANSRIKTVFNAQGFEFWYELFDPERDMERFLMLAKGFRGQSKYNLNIFLKEFGVELGQRLSPEAWKWCQENAK